MCSFEDAFGGHCLANSSIRSKSALASACFISGGASSKAWSKEPHSWRMLRTAHPITITRCVESQWCRSIKPTRRVDLPPLWSAQEQALGIR
jgi:hypothetical protein